jgi:hypothetical protein
MKVQIPKELRGTKFSKVLSIELNDFAIESLLPALFFLVMADGYGVGRNTRDDETLNKHLDLLANHQDLAGFEGSEGKLLLERLVRTTLITTIRTAADRNKERIASITPYSLLSLKTAETRGQRLVDVFTYQALKSVLPKEDDLKKLLRQIFGKGVNITERPELGGEYDGQTDLDTLTRLSLMLLDGFHSAPSRVKRDKEEASGACPVLVRAFGADIHSYLIAYHDRMPTQAFMHYLQGLLRFELYMYTLKLVYAVNELVVYPEQLPVAMQEEFYPSGPQVYLDFTGKMDSESAYMAKARVGRDIGAYQQFFTSNLMLRQLDSYVGSLRGGRWRTLIENELKGNETGPLYLQKLLTLQDHPQLGMLIETLAMNTTDKIRDFNSQTKNDQERDVQEEELAWLKAIENSGGESAVERVVALLGEAQRSDSVNHYLRWCWDVGGNEHPFSLIEGRRSYRNSWKYSPTNELLSVLVQLAATRIGSTEGQSTQSKEIKTIRLQDFLIFLERRFGILIDRPPAQFEGTEYVAAARENLRAMLRRLRQMGIFRDLSDDFTAQTLHPPYIGEQVEQVEA